MVRENFQALGIQQVIIDTVLGKAAGPAAEGPVVDARRTASGYQGGHGVTGEVVVLVCHRSTVQTAQGEDGVGAGAFHRGVIVGVVLQIFPGDKAHQGNGKVAAFHSFIDNNSVLTLKCLRKLSMTILSGHLTGGERHHGGGHRERQSDAGGNQNRDFLMTEFHDNRMLLFQFTGSEVQQSGGPFLEAVGELEAVKGFLVFIPLQVNRPPSTSAAAGHDRGPAGCLQ